MASLRARHSRTCNLGGKETTTPREERETIPGCSCRPVYSIRGASGAGHERIGRDLRTALRALRKRQTQEDDGEFIPQASIRFERWGKEWLASLERKANTVNSYRPTIAYATEAFGHKLVRKLGPGDVAAFNALLRKQKITDSTRAKHLRVLGACLNAAVSHGYAGRNPVQYLPRSEKPRPEKREAGYFENEELPRLFTELPEGLWRTICEVALKTGMREGELAALTWGDLDLIGRHVHVRRNYTAGELSVPKNHEKRTVDLTADVVELLGWWWGDLGKPENYELVFAREGHGGYIPHWVFTRQVLYPAMERGGILRVGPTGQDRTFHSFRHTYAKLALENGLQVTWLSRQLGHSSVQVTTGVYGHWERATAKAEAEKMAGVFGV
jgi:integrase